MVSQCAVPCIRCRFRSDIGPSVRSTAIPFTTLRYVGRKRWRLSTGGSAWRSRPAGAGAPVWRRPVVRFIASVRWRTFKISALPLLRKDSGRHGYPATCWCWLGLQLHAGSVTVSANHSLPWCNTSSSNSRCNARSCCSAVQVLALPAYIATARAAACSGLTASRCRGRRLARARRRAPPPPMADVLPHRQAISPLCLYIACQPAHSRRFILRGYFSRCV